MSTGKAIEHKGIVESISNEGILVKFASVSACASCHAKGVCSASDMEEKEILVPASGEHFITGEQVCVIMKAALGTKAVLIGYVYPFIVMLAVLITLNGIGISELRAGLLSLTALFPYYFIVYLFREKLERTFGFTIKKTV